MVGTKVVYIFEINNSVYQYFCRISYILPGNLNFWFLENRFRWIKPESLVKNGWLTHSTFLFGPSRSLQPLYRIFQYNDITERCILMRCSILILIVFFYILVIGEGKGFTWEITFQIFTKYRLFDTVLVLSIKTVFIKIKYSIFLPKYRRYEKNVSRKNFLFQRDLESCCWPFFLRSHIFCLLMKNFI